MPSRQSRLWLRNGVMGMLGTQDREDRVCWQVWLRYCICSSHLLTFESVFLNLWGAELAVKKHCLGWAVGIQTINQTLIIPPTKPSTARLDNTNVKKEMRMNHVQHLKSRMHRAVGTKSNAVCIWVLRHSRARPSDGAGTCSVYASKDSSLEDLEQFCLSWAFPDHDKICQVVLRKAEAKRRNKIC